MGNTFPFAQRPGLFRTNRLSCPERRTTAVFGCQLKTFIKYSTRSSTEGKKNQNAKRKQGFQFAVLAWHLNKQACSPFQHLQAVSVTAARAREDIAGRFPSLPFPQSPPACRRQPHSPSSAQHFEDASPGLCWPTGLQISLYFESIFGRDKFEGNIGKYFKGKEPFHILLQSDRQMAVLFFFFHIPCFICSGQWNRVS